jgi:hypothetical protein
MGSGGPAVASGSSPSGPQALPAQPPACPVCGTVVPDPNVAVLCASCGALVAARARQAVWASLAALAASLLGLLIAGVAIKLTVGASTAVVSTVIAVIAVAGLLGVAGGLGLRHVIGQVAARESSVARKFLVKSERIALAAAGALVVAALGLGYFVYRPLSIRPGIERAFQDRLGEFLNLPVDAGAPVDPQVVGPPRIRGKVLVLNHAGDYPGAPAGTLADAHFALPRELRAATPEEVGTVVWLDLEDRLVGYLTTAGDTGLGDELHTAVATATLIHLGTPPVVVDRQANLEGDEDVPPGRPRGRPAYRPPPVKVVLNYLLSLPREP